jgi:hypothetical protein
VSDIKTIIENEAGLKAFVSNVRGIHDRQTLLHYWRKAKLIKRLLILRKVSPGRTQVLIQPPRDFNYKTKKLLLRASVGFIAENIDFNTYYIFGLDEVLAQIPGANEVPLEQPLPVVSVQEIEVKPEPKKRGRKKTQKLN